MSTINQDTRSPPWLFALLLALWGACAEVLWFGILLGTVMEVLRYSQLQRDFDNADFNRISDLSTLILAGVAIYLLVTDGITTGLLHAVVWMPVTMLPLVLAQIISATGHLRLRNLFYSLRQSTLPTADQPVDLVYPYCILVLLAASIATTNYYLFLPGAALVSAYLLFRARARNRSIGIWTVLIVISLSSGITLAVGLNRLQSTLENVIGNWLFGYTPEPDPYHARTRIGDVGYIKRSDAIVWRVRTERPLDAPLLLMDAGYTSFHDNTWRVAGVREDFFRPLLANNGYFILGERDGRLAEIQLNGYTHDGRALLALPAGTHSISDLVADEVTMNSLKSIKIVAAVPLVTLHVAYTPDIILRSPPTAIDIQIPNLLEPLFTQVKNTISPRPLAAIDILHSVQRFFEDGFRYSLYLGDQPGGKDLKNFLTESRTGHCEYFATATTLLLRSFGVPARYITGYSVHEFIASEGQYVARQRHAHAWSQAYIDGAWQNVDTTPAIWAENEARERNPFEPIIDWFSWRWYHYLEWRAHHEDDFSKWLIAGAVLMCGWLYWRLFRRARIAGVTKSLSKTNAPLRISAYFQMEDELTRLGYPRSPGETPCNWLQRLKIERCPYLTATAEELARVYYMFKYRPQADKSALLTLLQELVERWRFEIIVKKNHTS